MPAVPLPTPGSAVPQPLHLVVDAGARFRLSVYGVGLACCAVELVAATGLPGGAAGDRTADDDAERAGLEVVDVMVVAGTVTDRMAPALRALYDDAPGVRVLSFGACSNTGGPYWDSYSVTKGVDQLLPVDVWVPGCPPRPEALLDGLRALSGQLGRPA